MTKSRLEAEPRNFFLNHISLERRETIINQRRRYHSASSRLLTAQMMASMVVTSPPDDDEAKVSLLSRSAQEAEAALDQSKFSITRNNGSANVKINAMSLLNSIPVLEAVYVQKRNPGPRLAEKYQAGLANVIAAAYDAFRTSPDGTPKGDIARSLNELYATYLLNRFHIATSLNESGWGIVPAVIDESYYGSHNPHHTTRFDVGVHASYDQGQQPELIYKIQCRSSRGQADEYTHQNPGISVVCMQEDLVLDKTGYKLPIEVIGYDILMEQGGNTNAAERLNERTGLLLDRLEP